MKQSNTQVPERGSHRQRLDIGKRSEQLQNSIERERDIVGKNIYDKPDNTIRLGFKNIHRFPSPHTQQVKYYVLQSESGKCGFQFDLQSFIETYKRWNKVYHSQHFKELTKVCWEKPTYQLAWLKDTEESTIKFGGVATVTTTYTTSCRFKHGVDDMGRWTWTTLREKKGIKTTIISAY